jgi:putative aldouronate transport system substrate-binding protein
MRTSSKVIVLLTMLAMLLPVAVMAGGQQGAEGEKPVPIRFMTSGDSAAPWITGEQNDRIFQEINQRLGIKLKVEAYKQGQYEKVNVAVASGDMPDLVVNRFPTNAVYQWIEDGVLIPLNDYFEYMPSVQAMCEKESWTGFDGKYYGYPFVTGKGTSNWCLVMRGDWLNNVGMEWPENLDDFWNVCEAFVNDDPDGNGQDDTYAFSNTKPGVDFNFLFGAYGLPHYDYNLDADGNVVAWFEHPAWMEGMKYAKAMWEAGFIEPEHMLNDRQMKEDKWYNGKVGIIYNALFRHVNRMRVSLAKVNPDAVMQFGDPPAGPNGDRAHGGWGKSAIYTGITAGSKRPDKAAEFLEFLVDDGRELLTLGIEGVHFTRSGDEITYIEEEREKDGFAKGGWAHPLAWGHVWWPLQAMYLPQTEPNREDALYSVEVASRNYIGNLIDYVPDAEVELGLQVEDIYNEYVINMLIGKIDLEAGYQEMRQKWYDNGGEQIIAEAQELYEK